MRAWVQVTSHVDCNCKESAIAWKTIASFSFSIA
jgi:hypothetical protein